MLHVLYYFSTVRNHSTNHGRWSKQVLRAAEHGDVWLLKAALLCKLKRLIAALLLGEDE